MNKKIFILFMALLVVPAASALWINNSWLNSTGLNSSINVTYPWNLTAVTVDTNWIFVEKLNSSHPGEASNEAITFNFSEHNKSYSGTYAPYYSSSSPTVKKITSNFLADLGGAVAYLNVTDCTMGAVKYESAAGTYDAIIGGADFSCAAKRLKVNLTALERGVNTLTLGYNASLHNCSGENETLNVTFYNEDRVAIELNGTAQVLITYWNATGVESNFTHTFTNTTHFSICLYPLNHSVKADAFFQYNTSNGWTHRYYLLNASLNNETQLLSLYNFNTTSTTETFKLTAVDEGYDFLPNLYVKMLRYYPSENLWRVVQMDKTDDFARTYFHVREQDTDYKFMFYNYTTLWKTTNPLHFYCPTTDDCVLTVIVETYEGGEGLFTDYSYDYNSTSNIFNLSWDDPDGLTDSITLQAWADSSGGRVLYCNTSLNSAAGTLNCNLSAASGSVWVSAFRTASPSKPIFLKLIETVSKAFYDILSSSGLASEGTLLGGFVAMAVIMVGALSPYTLVVTVPLALTIQFLFGWFNFLTLSFVVLASIMALIVGLLIKRE